MQYGYIRTNTENQSTQETYTAELRSFSLEHIFIDQNQSGAQIPPQLETLLETLQPYDTIVTHACTTLCEDPAIFQKIIAKIRNKKCSVRFLDLHDHGMTNPILKARKSLSHR